MKTPRPQTDYFRHRVLVERPVIKVEWCEAVADAPAYVETQPNGRQRCWGFIPETGKWLRVIVEPDGVTLHNAFFDRSFKPKSTPP